MAPPRRRTLDRGVAAGALFVFCSRGCLISFVAESCLTDRFDAVEQVRSVRALRLSPEHGADRDRLMEYDGEHTTEA